ncbi:fungal-specific transcription factor domain-containing protein [Xylaria palmicola]|nr:fungal-specific transcription factor domain-containing protein [Xylaria palmicola]
MLVNRRPIVPAETSQTKSTESGLSSRKVDYHRRVRCDRGLPSCANCAQLQQVCQGYGVRLSWPKEGNTKRFMTGGGAVFPAKSCKCTDIELVPTSCFDMEMYYYLVALRSSGRSLSPFYVSMDLNAEELGLLEYFQSTAFSTLATLSVDVTRVRDMLVRMALTDPSISARAVLHAILALSSLHRDGPQLQAAQHKTAAVGALGASAKNGINTTAEAAQHVAANMLLCSFEIHMGTDSHGHWPWYLLGARDIVKAAGLEAQVADSDIYQLVLWTYYHDVLARFSLLHWRRPSAPKAFEDEIGVKCEWRDLCASVTKLEIDIGPLPRILSRLGDVVDALCSRKHPPAPLKTLQKQMKASELGVRNVPELAVPPPASASYEGLRRMTVLTELYRTAVLVYIARICENKFGAQRDLGPLLDKGFAQIEGMDTCQRLLPVFILGCEANTDERRIAVLNLLRRTETTHVRSLECIRRGLDSIWIQDDLHADQDTVHDYMNKLSVVVSSSRTLPTFV